MLSHAIDRVGGKVSSLAKAKRSGKILIEDLSVEVPEQRLQQARRAAEVLGNDVFDKFPFLPGMTPMASDLTEMILNRTWRAALAGYVPEPFRALG